MGGLLPMSKKANIPALDDIEAGSLPTSIISKYHYSSESFSLGFPQVSNQMV